MSGQDDFVLVTVELHGRPTLAEAAHKLDVELDRLDPSYGVVALDPDRALYAVRVRHNHASQPWSDPKIRPLG